MTPVGEGDSSGSIARDTPAFEDHDDSVNVLAVASIALSGLGFLTLLRLADRRDRTPASDPTVQTQLDRRLNRLWPAVSEGRLAHLVHRLCSGAASGSGLLRLAEPEVVWPWVEAH